MQIGIKSNHSTVHLQAHTSSSSTASMSSEKRSNRPSSSALYSEAMYGQHYPDNGQVGVHQAVQEQPAQPSDPFLVDSLGKFNCESFL